MAELFSLPGYSPQLCSQITDAYYGGYSRRTIIQFKENDGGGEADKRKG